MSKGNSATPSYLFRINQEGNIMFEKNNPKKRYRVDKHTCPSCNKFCITFKCNENGFNKAELHAHRMELWLNNVEPRLTVGRGSPDSTPGHRRIQTSSARSTWFHGGLAGWTGCGGTGSLERNIKTSHVYVYTNICVKLILGRRPVHPLLPLRESPLLHKPSLRFFLTTFFTSSNAWGSSGVLKHVR